MKTLLLAFLIAVPTLAAAQSKRAIYDLQYLPKAGTVFGSSEASYTFGWYTIEDEATEEDVGKTDVMAWKFNQTVGYSILDNLFISASINYSMRTDDVDFEGARDDKFKQIGESDPSVALRFRALDSDWRIDLLAGGSITTGDKKSATSSKDGNNKLGGNSALVGIEAGKKLADTQFVLGLKYNKFFEADEKSAGEKSKRRSYDQLRIGPAALLHLTNQDFLKGFMSLNYSAKQKSGSVRTEPLTEFNLGGEYQHLINNNLLIRMGLTYQTFENNRVAGNEFHKDHFFTALAAANYQF